MSNKLPEPLELLQELVSLPGPPGQESAVRACVAHYLDTLGLPHRTDAKGNLLTTPGSSIPESPSTVVTAHLDEIALMVRTIEPDGKLTVVPLGGVHPFKWGEGPLEILPLNADPIPAALSFGTTHTTAPQSPAQQSRDGAAVSWEMARVITGLSKQNLEERSIRPGTRVILARHRRSLWPLSNGLLGSYFLDDRAALVVWLHTLQRLREEPPTNILFAATSSEEVGGEGALYLLQGLPKPPEICLALEIGPIAPDAPLPLDATPSVWSADAYSASDPRDLDLLQEIGSELGFPIGFQVLSRGGSDASCAAAKGLCARPVTLAFPTESSHGFEILHQDAMPNLVQLTVAYLQRQSKLQPPNQVGCP